MTNPFCGNSIVASFAKIVYEKLMTREYVCYSDVLTAYFDRDSGYYNSHSLYGKDGSDQLKKAFPAVVKLLNEYQADCVQDNGKKGKGKAFVYIGELPNPLAKLIAEAEQDSIESYAIFRWLYRGKWHTDQMLTNIGLLPEFNKAITDRKVLKFKYRPYRLSEYEIIFHPQFLKEYNGRWYVLGHANRKPYDGHNIAIDRIASDLEVLADTEYIAAKPNSFDQLFKTIVGVTHVEGAKVSRIVLRTHTIESHGLMTTKHIHDSQIETLPFDDHNDGKYGEFILDVEINKELLNRIFSFGPAIEVVSPVSLRNKIRREVSKMYGMYEKTPKNKKEILL